MPVIQISKIILRKGPSADLPGAPTLLSPLTFPAGLDNGELAFSTDEGRLFIGHNPQSGNVNFDRATFPYQNIEVLTEAATDTLSEIIGRHERAGGSKDFNVSALAPTGGSWASVVVPRIGDPSYAFRLEYNTGTAAIIDYSAFATNGQPLKTGRMTVSYFTGEAEPQIVDDALAYRRLDVLNPDNFDATKAFNLMELRFIVAGPTGAEYLLFQYKNRMSTVLNFRFKVSIPEV